MYPDSLIRVLAGSMVLLGIALAHWVSPWWLLLPAFSGLNLIQSAFTGFCPPTILLRRMGWVHRDGRIRIGRENHR
jgi:hypothetical protein